MKRIILCALVLVLLLIGGAASADRHLYAIEDFREETDTAYQLIPGKVILTERVDGKMHVEGRVLIRNALPCPVDYAASGFLVGYSESTGESVVINGYSARPAVAAQDGYSLLTFSEDVDMNIREDWVFWPHFSLGDAPSMPEFIGVGDAGLAPYSGSDAIKAYRYLDDLPVGVYQCVIVFGDQNGRFLWAEDKTINTESGFEVSASLEDYEVRLFREYGKEPSQAEIIVQKK